MSKQTIFVIPDTHVPFHDQAAWNETLGCIDKVNPWGVVIIGDFADFYSISSHTRNPDRKHQLREEVAAVNRELDVLASVFKGPVCFIEGNHEDRLRRYLWDRAPEMFGVVDTTSLFKLWERGWKHVPYRQSLKIGKVTYKHDYGGKAGKYAAEQSLEGFGGNLVIGHTHRGKVTYLGEGRPDGSPHFCLNVGWLGDLEQMDYVDPDKVRRDWQTGFGLVHYLRGYARAEFIPIVRGRALL